MRLLALMATLVFAALASAGGPPQVRYRVVEYYTAPPPPVEIRYVIRQAAPPPVMYVERPAVQYVPAAPMYFVPQAAPQQKFPTPVRNFFFGRQSSRASRSSGAC